MYAVGGTILPADPSNPAMVASPPPGNIYSVGDTYPPVLNNVGAGALGVVGSADSRWRGSQHSRSTIDCPNYLTALYNAAMQKPDGDRFPDLSGLRRLELGVGWGRSDWSGGSVPGSQRVLLTTSRSMACNSVRVRSQVPPQPIRTTSRRMTLHRGAPGDTRPLFAQHINPDPQFPTEGLPVLAKVTWIFPPWNYCEHPSNASNWKSADGGPLLIVRSWML